MIRLTVHGEEELDRIAGRLVRARGNVRAELAQGLRRAAKPAVEDLKRAIRTADVHGKKKPYRFRVVNGETKRKKIRRFTGRGVDTFPLRAPMARAVEAQISTGSDNPRVRIAMRTGSIPPRIRRVVKYVVGEAKRWRHPVMGNREVWVSQNAPNVWEPVARRHLDDFRREVDSAIDRAARRIER